MSLLEIIPGDPKLEDYHTKNGRGPGPRSNVSKGHMVPFCPLISTLSNFKETELLGRVHNGGDEPENSGYNLKHICNSISLYIIRNQKIL